MGILEEYRTAAAGRVESLPARPSRANPSFFQAESDIID
jgi:hypothetical protein